MQMRNKCYMRKIAFHLLLSLKIIKKVTTKKIKMKKNISSTDRIVRIVLAAILGGLYFTGTVTGTAGIVLVVVAVIALGTALINFCPAYALLGISTCKVKS